MARRQHITAILVSAVLAFFAISFLLSSSSDDKPGFAPLDQAAPNSVSSGSGFSSQDASKESIVDLDHVPGSILTGGSIAPKLGNETAKAELGRAAWKLFHTMMARFPEEPTDDDSLALKTYIQLFARLYPCGECAAHFRTLLEKFPPQVSSRNAAAGWACHVHNQVNERLKKDIFDCSNIGDFYDCGCAEDEKKEKEEGGEGAEEAAVELQ